MVDNFLLNLVLRGASARGTARSLPHVTTRVPSIASDDEIRAQEPLEVETEGDSKDRETDRRDTHRLREPTKTARAFLSSDHLQPFVERAETTSDQPQSEILARPAGGLANARRSSTDGTSSVESGDSMAIARQMSSQAKDEISPDATSRSSAASLGTGPVIPVLPFANAALPSRASPVLADEKTVESRPHCERPASDARTRRAPAPLRLSLELDQPLTGPVSRPPPVVTTEPQLDREAIGRAHDDLVALLGRLESLVDHLEDHREDQQQARHEWHLELASPSASPSAPPLAPQGFRAIAAQRRHADRNWY